MQYLKYIIILLFITSFILPIGYEDYLGYVGANLAFQMLVGSFEKLNSVVQGSKLFSLKFTSEFILSIILGSVNIFFVGGYILFLFKNKYSIMLSGLALISMLSWGIAYEVYYGYGYSLWLLSGLFLFYASAKNTFNASFRKLLKTPLMIPGYVVALIVIGIFYLNIVNN